MFSLREMFLGRQPMGEKKWGGIIIGLVVSTELKDKPAGDEWGHRHQHRHILLISASFIWTHWSSTSLLTWRQSFQTLSMENFSWLQLFEIHPASWLEKADPHPQSHLGKFLLQEPSPRPSLVLTCLLFCFRQCVNLPCIGSNYLGQIS